MPSASLPAYNRMVGPPSVNEDDLSILVIPEDGSGSKTFTLARLPTSRTLNLMFLRCFARAVGPTGSRKTLSSVTSFHATLSTFARRIHEIDPSLSHPHELAPHHLDYLRIPGGITSYNRIGVLRVLFRGETSLQPAFLAALFRSIAQPQPATRVTAYTASEFRTIMDTARQTTKGALHRIRGVREELRAASASVDPVSDRLRSLQIFSDTGSIELALEGTGPSPSLRGRLHRRYSRELFPTRDEVSALCVLLLGATGHNPSTLLSFTSSFVQSISDDRPSSDVVFTRASKPRRGPRHSEMTVALQHTSLDPETGAERYEPDNFRSQLGLYRIALDLCADARRLVGTDKLLVSYATNARTPTGRLSALTPDSFESRIRLVNADGSSSPVRATSLRKYYLEKAQRPVANTSETLASKYLAKNPQSLNDYRKVVGSTLNEVVSKARGSMGVRVLSPAARAEAIADPKAFGGTWGISASEVTRILEGQNDTVAASCMNERASPFTIDTDGRCVASFLLCLGCPCALSEPRHHPVQALLWQKLDVMRPTIEVDVWSTRFAQSFSELTDLLDRQNVVVSEAASRASALDDRFLDALLDGLLERR